MKRSTYFTILASFLTTAHGLLGSSWSVTNVPSTGLTDITFPITFVEADHISGYFFAQQFNFVGVNDGGYIGIQPRPDTVSGKAVLHGVFSSFSAGTTTNDPNCSSGVDGGPGVSCALGWNGVYGRRYDFEVKFSDSNGPLWTGTAIDSVTGQRIHIGSYTLPSGSGGIKSSQVGFVEWYPWNGGEPTNHCKHLPYQQTIFGDPTTTHAGSVGTQSLAYEYGDCVGQVAFHTEKVVGGAENNCGYKIQSG